MLRNRRKFGAWSKYGNFLKIFKNIQKYLKIFKRINKKFFPRDFYNFFQKIFLKSRGKLVKM